MKQINILGMGQKAIANTFTAQQRQNCYLEYSDDKSVTAAICIAGSTLFSNLGLYPVRGYYVLNTLIYFVTRNKFKSIDAAGNIVVLGTLLTSSGFVSIEYNGLQFCMVDGTYGYTYTLDTTTFAQIVTVGFPGGDVVEFIDGYFIVNKPATGQFFVSKSYDGMVWDALNFATAESCPDNIVGIFNYHGQLTIFGDRTIEFWANSGALDFPFSRMNGSTLEVGLESMQTVCDFDGEIIFLAKSRMGENQVVKLSGGQIQKISTPDIDYIINGYAVKSDATAMSYIFNGHKFYQITFPLGGGSWLYDGTMNAWSKIKSYGMLTHRSRYAFNFLGDSYQTDMSNGKIYLMSRDVHTENGDPIEFEITGKHVFNGLERIAISELQIEMDTGNDTTLNPQVMLSISKDNGNTWIERWTSMGNTGEFKTRARWRRLGAARDWTFKIRITDAVKRIVLGAFIRL